MSLQVSIVIPAYNEELRLPGTLQSIGEYLTSSFKPGEVEVIVVSDGSTDQTDKVVKDSGYPFIRLLSYKKNKGKGFALRYGALESKGDLVLLNDADGSTPIQELDRLRAFVAQGADVVIGSRALASSETKVKTVWYRKFIGRTFAFIVNTLIVPGIADTQCGFKLFTRKASDELFSRQRSERFSFDVELLFLANRLGFKIKEVSVNWTNAPGSKVNLVKDSIAMLLDIFRFRWMAICGIYEHRLSKSDITPSE
jgi:dolichyl-phosphate beta-glucosyltransferase